MDFLEDTLPFPVSEVRQETSTLCFPACIESLLKDRGEVKTQSEIVSQFPLELRINHPTEAGSPLGLKSIETVLKELGLSDEPLLSSGEDSAAAMRAYLADKPALWHRALVATTAGQFHCMRLAKVRDDGFIVMDPAVGKLVFRQTEDFESEKPRFVFLRM